MIKKGDFFIITEWDELDKTRRCMEIGPAVRDESVHKAVHVKKCVGVTGRVISYRGRCTPDGLWDGIGESYVTKVTLNRLRSGVQ